MNAAALLSQGIDGFVMFQVEERAGHCYSESGRSGRRLPDRTDQSDLQLSTGEMLLRLVLDLI